MFISESGYVREAKVEWVESEIFCYRAISQRPGGKED